MRYGSRGAMRCVCWLAHGARSPVSVLWATCADDSCGAADGASLPLGLSAQRYHKHKLARRPDTSALPPESVCARHFAPPVPRALFACGARSQGDPVCAAEARSDERIRAGGCLSRAAASFRPTPLGASTAGQSRSDLRTRGRRAGAAGERRGRAKQQAHPKGKQSDARPAKTQVARAITRPDTPRALSGRSAAAWRRLTW